MFKLFSLYCKGEKAKEQEETELKRRKERVKAQQNMFEKVIEKSLLDLTLDLYDFDNNSKFLPDHISERLGARFRQLTPKEAELLCNLKIEAD
jgi:hypothetical protein